jgi:hypothetical protein
MHLVRNRILATTHGKRVLIYLRLRWRSGAVMFSHVELTALDSDGRRTSLRDDEKALEHEPL